MSEPSAFEAPLVGDVQPGDRWFVASVNPPSPFADLDSEPRGGG